MKKYNTVAVVDGYEEELFVCELTADDVAKAEKEFSLYMQCEGETYKQDENKHPTIGKFFELYFGECEADPYGIYWYSPNRYICNNKNVADRFMKLAKQLDYHDTYNQCYCTVKQDGKTIDVFGGEY